MTTQEKIRQALERSMDDLLDGRVPGPLTSLRLVELAGVKRHRLTHDNPEINARFQERTRELNRTKPEVESLRTALSDERQRNARLTAANRDLDKRLKAYANALLDVLEERDSLRNRLARRDYLINGVSGGLF